MLMKDTWSKFLTYALSMLCELDGNLTTSKPGSLEFQRFCGKNAELWTFRLNSTLIFLH